MIGRSTRSAHDGAQASPASPSQAAPGKRSQVATRYGSAVQAKAAPGGAAPARGGGGSSALVGQLHQNPGGLGMTVDVTPEWLSWLSGPANGSANGESVPDIESGDTGTSTEIAGTPFVTGAGDVDADGNPVDIHINDIDQGALGDCYFLAVLAAVARVRPDFIRNMIEDHGDGTYTVTFQTEQGVWDSIWGTRTAQQVTVDSRFWANSSGTPIYAGVGDRGSDGPELWVMIIEKAWAQLHGGYGEITGGNVDDDAREAVTGEEADYVDPTDLSASELSNRLNTHFNENSLPVIFWSHGDEKSKKLDANGVVTNHEYALNNFNHSAGTADLYNPHGHNHLEGVDIAFLRANFQQVRFLGLPSR